MSVTTRWPLETYATVDDFLVAYTGDAFNRGHYAHSPTIYQAMRTGAHSYLGAAHRARMTHLYNIAGSNTYDFKELGMETLVGDPFMDFTATGCSLTSAE